MWRRGKRRKNNKNAQEIRKRIKCAFFFENKEAGKGKTGWRNSRAFWYAEILEDAMNYRVFQQVLGGM